MDLLYQEQINMDRALRYFNSLNTKEKDKLGTLMAAEAGIGVEEWNRFVSSQRIQIHSRNTRSSDGFPRMIPYSQSAAILAGSNDFYEDRTCDGDDADSDWVFSFPVSNPIPEKLRWSTSSPLVYVAFHVAYQGKLLGFRLNSDHVGLCIGQTGVTAAGGAWHVFYHLYLAQA